VKLNIRREGRNRTPSGSVLDGTVSDNDEAKTPDLENFFEWVKKRGNQRGFWFKSFFPDSRDD